MSDQKHNVPKQLRFGQGGKLSREPNAPTASGGAGKIMTDFQEIKWTPRKLTVTIVLLSIPYLIATIVSFMAGNNLVGFLFLGIGAFVVVIYLLLRYIERADF